MRRRIFALSLALLVVAPHARAQSALEEGSNANTWLFGADGGLSAAYRLGASGGTMATKLAGAVVEVLAGGAWTGVPGSTAASGVVVNAVGGSWPPSSKVPPLSVVGLGEASHDAGSELAPAVTISPLGGAYAGTVAVTVRALPSPASTGELTLALTLNGAPIAVTGTEHTTYLVLDGEWTLEATASQDDGSGSAWTKVRSRTYTLSGPTPYRRDSDGDGVPDLVEAAWGMDPFDSDLTVDRDGDGWSDLDEKLRGTNPDSAASVPADLDGDGWSDWDEERRGTNPEDPSSRPSARRLWEVELLLAGTAWLDDESTEPHPDAGTVTVTDSSWELLAEVATDLLVWPALRVPIGRPLIVVARPEPAATALSNLKGWVTSVPDVTSADIAAVLDSSEAKWTTAAGWKADYNAALSGALVQDRDVALGPSSGVGVALVEAVVAWQAGLESGAPVLLGEPDGPMPLDAVAAAATYPGGLDGLQVDLAALAQAGEPLDGLTAMVVGLHASPDPQAEVPVTRALALAIQQPDGTAVAEQARYVARLVARDGLTAVLLFAAGGVEPGANPWEPADDADSDTVANEVEVASSPAQSTDPLLSDSDGDGWGDFADPCAVQGANACLTGDLLTADLDGDGVMDSLDNCFGVPNPKQIDLNGDGIGNACEAPARIGLPATNVKVEVGGQVLFTSITSAAATPPVSYEWVVDGAVVSSAPSAGSLSFATPGAHTVELWAGAPTLSLTDSRTVAVLPVSALICASLDCNDHDPCTVDACDPATGCTHLGVGGCIPCVVSAHCDDGDPCTADPCGPEHTCASMAPLSGVACDDGDPCTAGDQCEAGACVGSTDACDDGDPCTTDACDAVGACSHADDPDADPAICPQCAVDADCDGDAMCAGGYCCTSGIALDGTPVEIPEGSTTAFALCLLEGQEISVVTRGSGGQASVALTAPSGEVLQEGNGSVPVLLREVESIPASGPWTLSIAPLAGATGPFTVEVWDIPGDAIVTIPAFDEPAVPEVTVIGQEAEVWFDAVAGQDIAISGYMSLGCSLVSVVKPGGAFILPPTNVCGSLFIDVTEVSETGTFRVVVDPNQGAVGPLTITVWDVPADAQTVVVPDGTPAPMPLDGVGAKGVFLFDGTAGDRVSVLVSAPYLGSCGVITAFTPSGALMAGGALSCGGQYFDALTLSETGTYSIHVDPTATVVGTWTTTIWTLPEELPIPVTVDGPSAQVPLSLPGLNAIISFDAVAGMEVGIMNVAFPTWCSVVDLFAPSGLQLIDTGLGCGTWFSERVVLPETGSYAFVIDPYGAGTATTSVSVWTMPPDPVLTVVLDGGPASVTTTAIGQNVLFELDAPAGTKVALPITETSCVDWVVEASDGTVLVSKNTCGNGILETITLPSSGITTISADIAGTATSTITLSATTVP